MMKNNYLKYWWIITFSLSLTSGIVAQKANTGLKKKPVACLYGTMSPHTDMPAWFSSMKQWGVDRYYLYSANYRGYQYKINSPVQMGYDKSNFTSVGLLSDFNPLYSKYINQQEVADQEKVIYKVNEECEKNGIELGYMIPFPLFPVQQLSVVKEVQPEFVRPDGRLNIYSPLIPDLLKDEIRHIRKKLPALKSICIWLAEGCGEIYKFENDDLIGNKQWLQPILQAFDEVCRELNIEGIVFAHDYFHTVKTRRQAFEVSAAFPSLILMEDVSWPEENTFMPFMGHFTNADLKTVKDVPLFLNFLTDTEYIGQGNWPAVLPRWWQQNCLAAYKVNTAIIAGRTFFWDNAKTDKNFNRLNAHLLMLFAKNPNADAKQMLSMAAKATFGNKISPALITILWETEPIIKDIIGINGISPLNHSGFPKPYYLDKDYYTWSLNMKAIDDLFLPPGTKLYPLLNDSLNAGEYWRYQLQLVSKPYTEYININTNAIKWLEANIPIIKKEVKALSPAHAGQFIKGYEELLLLAQAMQYFIEAGKVHFDWYRAKTITKDQALELMKPLAEKLRSIAKLDTGYALGHAKAINQFANEIENLQFSKGRW